MMCGNQMTGTLVVSLSTGAGYQSTTILPVQRVLGNKLVVGILVINITASATVTVTVEISYDGGQTWKSAGNTTATAAGPKEVSVTGMDAALVRIKVDLAGTTQWALVSITKNYSNQ